MKIISVEELHERTDDDVRVAAIEPIVITSQGRQMAMLSAVRISVLGCRALVAQASSLRVGRVSNPPAPLLGGVGCVGQWPSAGCRRLANGRRAQGQPWRADWKSANPQAGSLRYEVGRRRLAGRRSSARN
jgi:hypothetical protein